jgi:hypothetical protein
MLNARVVAVGAIGSATFALPSVHQPPRNPLARLELTLAEFAIDAAV